MYAHDAGATRYSPLAQINTGNVSMLTQAWTYDTKPKPDAMPRDARTTPLVINGVMYFVTGFQSVVAVEPETGKQLWSFEHKRNARPAKGMAYWPGNKNSPPTLFFGTDDGFLIALNAKTGKPVPGFAKEGELELRKGMKDNYPNATYGLNGTAIVYKNLVITGSHVQDNGTLGGKGDVRAWDASTGELVWTFHTVPQPGETGHETWLDNGSNGGGWKDRSGVNVWSTFTLDAQTGTLLMTLGSPSDDRYGGDRPGANLFGNSLVALDAATGKLKWYFQTVHHDLWDTDLPPQPTLVDVVHDGKKIPALVQAGKTGLIFILDRRDGKPLYGKEERAVPNGDVPGEWYSPTQPFPLKPPPLARMTWKKDEIASFTPEHRKYCEELFKDAQNDGPFAPVRMTNTVVFPGPDGGFNWGGGSFDPKLGYFFINSHDRGEVTRMAAPTPGTSKQKGAGDPSTQPPYVRKNAGNIVNPATGWPCQAPPWGELFAINVNTGDVAWRIPVGRVESLEALGFKDTGAYNIGGSVATAGGLRSSAPRAISISTHMNPKPPSCCGRPSCRRMGTPIPYLSGKNGKQYLALVANETVVAFRLP